MMIKRALFAVAGLALLGGVASCGDDDGAPTPDAAIQPDAGADGAVLPDAGPDAQVTQGCTGDPLAQPGELGACCNSADDCVSGNCFGGWCFRACADDSDCAPVAAGPFPTGTPTHCQGNQFGWAQWCMPGTLAHCGAAGDPACPEGETCTVGWNDAAPNPAPDGIRGICVTSFTVGVLNVGDTCDDPTQSVPDMYRCSMANYHVGGCWDRRCTMVCDPAAQTDPCPQGMHCLGPVAFTVDNAPLSGAGYCVGASCGHAEFTGDDLNDLRLPGRDAECGTGEICLMHGINAGAEGNIQEYTCWPSVPSLARPGEACEQSPKYDMGCDHAFLCIQAQAERDPAGAPCNDDEDCDTDKVCVSPPSIGPRRCSPKPDPGVCSKHCRTDADCTNMGTEAAYCNRENRTMSNGAEGFITYCMPWHFISEEPEVRCDTNADCSLDTGEGCIVASVQSGTTFCLPHVTQDATGVDCSTGGVGACQAGEACVEDPDTATFACTVVQAFGDPCDADEKHRCLGGSCLGIDFEADPGDNTFCAGWCQSNADCGPLQVCDWVINAVNDPADPDDTVASGHCRPMVVRTGSGCAAPGDCTNGDGCDTTTGRCYTSSAQWGDACAAHSDCPQYGLCDTNLLATGTCYRPGCDPANGNTDCDGQGACSDQLPLGLCLADCTTTADCTRSGEGFVCTSGACVLPLR